MIRVIVGDVREKLAELPDESVHCVVTSPPYFGLRDYGIEGQIGLESTPVEFVAVMVEVFREVRRVLRKDGTLWLNLGDSYNNFRVSKGPGQAVHGRDKLNGKPAPDSGPRGWSGLKEKDLVGIPWRVAFALQADGWYLRQDIIWSKPNPMPESVTDRCTKAHEYLFLLSKSARYHYDADAIREVTGSEMSQEEYAAKTAPGATWKSGRVIGEERDTGQVLRQNGGAHKTDGGLSHTDGRNRRSVWTVATQPFKTSKTSHFATFPPDLIEPCIKAGCPKDCCAKCGAPVVREVERTAMVLDRSERTHEKGHTRSSGTMLEPPTCLTTGWAKSCTCDAGVMVRGTLIVDEADTRPGVVLDPFGGAGTTGLVADRLQRDAILIELNPAYAAMAGQRITDAGPLFAEVGG